MLQPHNVDVLRRAVEGTVLLPGDDEYDPARAVWNAMVDRRPALIAGCANSDDVAAAIRFAREHDLEIGVRCGGHGIVGHAVPEGGLMIDLTSMGGVEVDLDQRRALVQGGALLGAMDHTTLPHGLATTAGNVSHTGVGGLALGGGMGWLAREHGLTCDNAVSFEVVTAEGATVRASADEHPDLFWGLRGGGGNFGVVTEFEFRLHPVSGHAVVANFWFTLDQAAKVLRGWRDLLSTSPRAATLTAEVGQVGSEPRLAVGFVWTGADGGEAALLDEFGALGRPVHRRVDHMTYLELQTMQDSPQGHTFRRYWKGHYFKALPDEMLEQFALRGSAGGDGALLPAASLQAYGGAIAEVPDEATAFSHRDTLVEFVAAARWDDPAEDEPRISNARAYSAAMAPFADGHYVNALTDEGRSGLRGAYPPHKLARLTALKNDWDPDNVFRLNHNIPPSRP